MISFFDFVINELRLNTLHFGFTSTGREKQWIQPLFSYTCKAISNLWEVFILQNFLISFMSKLFRTLEYFDKAPSDLKAGIIEILGKVFRSGVWVQCLKTEEKCRRFRSAFKVYESKWSGKMGWAKKEVQPDNSSRNGPVMGASRHQTEQPLQDNHD